MSNKNKITIDHETAKQILNNDIPDGFPYQILYEAQWVDDGKWSYQDVYVLYNGKIYYTYNSKTGSYYSDYLWRLDDEDTIELTEVSEVDYITARLQDDSSNLLELVK